MPPPEVGCQLLQRLLEQDWPTALQYAHNSDLDHSHEEEFFLLVYMGPSVPDAEPLAPWKIGEAILNQSDADFPMEFQGEDQQWVGIHQAPGSLTICGMDGLGRDRAAPFALVMEIPPDWGYGRQARYLSRLLMRPLVPFKESPASLETVRLYIRMIIEAIQHYPWRGGRIQGTDVRIPSKAVPAANALQFIRRFLHLPLNRSDVAHAVGVSESYLTALFKERYNTNLTDYMLMERVIRADKLLIHTRFPVAEIGERCGFSSTTYFIRAYRKIRVQTPLKIRQLARKPSSSNWAADLFHVENCARLEPVSRGQAEGVSNLLLPTPRYPLLIANATQYPLEVARHSAPGEFRSSPAIGPMEMRLVWNPAPSAWRLSCQGQVLGHYIADRNTSQILVDDSSFPAQ